MIRRDRTARDWDPIITNDSPTEAIRGGAAIATALMSRRVLSLCVTVLLARLLTPEEFGAVAVITAVLALGLVLQQAGLSNATVQRDQVSSQAISTLFWINATLGLALTVAFAAAAPLIAGFFKSPELRTLCQVASLTFLLNGLAVQHRALLQRSQRFTTTARVEVVSTLVGGIVAVAVAVAGFGYWALVAQILTSDACALLGLVGAVRWPLSRPALTTEVREMVVFGASLLGFHLVLTVANNLHVVLLGRSVGTAPVGIYTRAYALASIPQTLLQSSAAHVALPKLSRVKHDGAGFATFYYAGVQLLSLVALPVALAFALFGSQIALVVYGSQWGDVSDLLRIFSISLAVAPLLHSTGPVFVARGEPHRMLRWGVFSSCGVMLGTLIGLRWGIIGVAWGWSTAFLVLLVPCLMYTYRGTDLTLGGLVRAVGGIYAAAICTLPVGWGAHLVFAALPVLPELILSLGVTLICYVGLCYFAFGQKALITMVAARLLRKSGRAAA